MTNKRLYPLRCLCGHSKILLQRLVSSNVVSQVCSISTAPVAAGLNHITASSAKFASLTPNPLREKFNGRMVYAVPLIIFMDDVSGNVSKQWNKHHAIYMSNANLPREMLEKEFFVRFVTSSPHAAPMELMRAMKESIWYVHPFCRLAHILSQWSRFAVLRLNLGLLRGIARTVKRSSLFHTGCSSLATIPCKPKNAATLG